MSYPIPWILMALMVAMVMEMLIKNVITAIKTVAIGCCEFHEIYFPIENILYSVSFH